MTDMSQTSSMAPGRSAQAGTLVEKLVRLEPQAAANLLASEPDPTIIDVLTALPTARAMALLPRLDFARRTRILKAVSPDQRERWLYNQHYPKGTIGRLMEPIVATFLPDTTVWEAVEQLRSMVKQAFISYGYVVEGDGRLTGALVMRELLLAVPTQRLRDVMVPRPFSLQASQQVARVIPLVQSQLFPEYPVCDEQGRIIGIVRGYALFQEQTLELSAQPGKMVGIDREERVQTNAWRSLHLRHPWLQVNLVSSFLAAGVVGFFENVVVQVVAVAAFVPVMVGQSASTGGQALAVALRGLTLGEVKPDGWRALFNKEIIVGLGNGLLVGLAAALGIYVYARLHGHAGAAGLAMIMLLAMTVSTIVSSVVGGTMPLLMKYLGFDPAAAATIMVGGITRVISIAAFLAFTQWLLV